MNAAEVSIQELCDHADEVVERASQGERITITRSGRAVAEVRPVSTTALSADAILSRWHTMPSVDPAVLRVGIDVSLDATLWLSSYILRIMKVVKIRRVGNSNVISIPREFEAQGYAPGSSVLVEELPDGELRIMSTEKVSERIRQVGARLVAQHGEALQILADHDPDALRR
jgi:prevent-host-death family protein